MKINWELPRYSAHCWQMWIQSHMFISREILKVQNQSCYLLGRTLFLYLQNLWYHIFFSVQFTSVTQSCPTVCNPVNRSTPGLPVHHQLPELTQMHRVGDAIQPSHPLSPLSPPSPNPSQHQGLFQSVNSSPKYWSFSFSISPSNEQSGLISFRMDWLDLLAVQGTLKSLLQHHSSKALVLWCSAFFTVQLSHPYVTTGKTIALTRWTFVGKVMSLLLNTLSRFVITFFHGASVFSFHGYSHHLQWFWNPRK